MTVERAPIELINEEDIALVDFAVRHELLPDGWCACMDFGMKPGDDPGEHRRHVGAALLMRAERACAKVVRNSENRRLFG